MKQKRIALTVSLPPLLAKEFERLSKDEAKNKSQLFRDMIRSYQQRRLEQEFAELQRYGAKQARKKNLFTEDDIDALVFQDR